MLCRFATRLAECGAVEDGRDLFQEARRLFEAMPADRGRKFVLLNLVMACADLSLWSEGKALAAEIECLFDQEPKNIFKKTTAMLVVAAWAALGHMEEVERFIGKLPVSESALLWEGAILQTAQREGWPEIPSLLNNRKQAERAPTVVPELALRLTSSALPPEERRAVMEEILKAADLKG